MSSTVLRPIAHVFNEDTREQATIAVNAALSLVEESKSSADDHGHFRVHFGDIVTTYPGYPAPDAHAQFITNVAQLAPEFGMKMIGGNDSTGYAFQITT